MNFVLLILYFILSVSGSTFIKLGSSETVKTIFTIPIINMNFSFYSLLGFIMYGASFILYTILLSRFELSFISPLTVGIVYILLMLTAFIFFKEPITTFKVIGSILILAGIILMVIKK